MVHQLLTGTSPLVRSCWARYARRPDNERMCPNDCDTIEDVEHLFWGCLMYAAQRMRHFGQRNQIGISCSAIQNQFSNSWMKLVTRPHPQFKMRRQNEERDIRLVIYRKSENAMVWLPRNAQKRIFFTPFSPFLAKKICFRKSGSISF